MAKTASKSDAGDTLKGVYHALISKGTRFLNIQKEGVQEISIETQADIDELNHRFIESEFESLVMI